MNLRPAPLGIYVAFLLLSFAGSGGADRGYSRDDTPQTDADRDILSGYLHALEHRDWEVAQAYWRGSDLARSERLGIRYDGLPLKIDGDSPLYRAAPGGLAGYAVERLESHPLVALLDSALGDPMRSTAALTSLPAVLSIRAECRRAGAGTGWNFAYVVVNEDGDWRFTKPVSVAIEACASREGAVQIGRYIRTITGPDMKGRFPALAALDSFVAATLERLQVPAARRARLEREKIDYLFVRPELVELLAGAPTVGVANLQLDVVVTHHPCHLHELTHLLVNFWLEELPLYTQPLLQEGLAVHLGGRWGRAPDFLTHVGRFTLETEFVTLASLLTWDGFHRQGADLTYAPAGVVAGWVLDSAGTAGLAWVYRALSGDAEEVQAMDGETVASVLATTLGLSGSGEPLRSEAALSEALAAYLETLPPNPLHPTPHELDSPSQKACFATIRNDSLAVVVAATDTNWNIRIATEPGGSLHGALLLLAPDGTAATSALFDEHFPDGETPPALAALRFSPEEAGWYDYTRDLLLAKHIASFWPDSSYYEPRVSQLRLTWPRDLLPWDLSEYRDRLRVVSTP